MADNYERDKIKKYIGSYIAALNAVDAICFTAGIGEHTPELRELVLKDMSYFGIELDNKANYGVENGFDACITAPHSSIPVYVIATNEELAIARETVELVSKLKK